MVGKARCGHCPQETEQSLWCRNCDEGSGQTHHHADEHFLHRESLTPHNDPKLFHILNMKTLRNKKKLAPSDGANTKSRHSDPRTGILS